ncbi:hypothetical protein LAZ40_16395 [Cereibacter sphaeroides]|uniref:NYN domain-containing protein n=1 Tax=Cereibacter sphaeroides TaxID=1063 RepID=UPI001F1984BA|nr:hypothetical protein [Cereibacter sphaeroides]MCE6960606.1 hypothetical protein [Cereibacter sphaeroides]MCE6970127.1 hypothetical protein [Cereibacter sphaeroides]MCE6971440.1 hypothetical protein [Cereibacter sphaeroides]
MGVPFILLLLSLCGAIACLLIPGLRDVLLISGSMCVASAFLLVRAWFTCGRPLRRARPKWIVVDGSNVMYWKDNTPRVETVRDVVRHLEDLGFTPGVIFDANAGYLLDGKYQHDDALGRQLGLPPDRVMVVDKGTPADPMIITAARDLEARVVTNDRYRDWADLHHEVRRQGFLIRGGYRAGRIWLDLDDPEAVGVAALGERSGRL